jgi:RNA polymerase sigma factor (sigma-70 family)
LSKVNAIFTILVHQAAVGPENQKRSSAVQQVPSATKDLRAAIVAEIPRLRRHAVSLLYNWADADDLIQDCLETALAKQATLKDPTRLRPWMFAILNNLFLMRLRGSARHGVSGSLDDFSDTLAAAAPPEDRGLALDLAHAMGRLSFEHRQILLLVNLDGYSYDDVAEILAIPRGTVMSRLARARERLRALLENRDLRAAEA